MSSTTIVHFDTQSYPQLLVGDTERRRPAPSVNTSSHWEGALVITSQGLIFPPTLCKSEVWGLIPRPKTLESQKIASRWEGIFSSPPKKKPGIKFQPTFSEGLWPWCDMTILPFQSVSFFGKVGRNSKFLEIANVMLSVLDDSNVMVAWSYQTQRNSRSIHHWKRPMWINKKKTQNAFFYVYWFFNFISKTRLTVLHFPTQNVQPPKVPKWNFVHVSEWVPPPSKMVYIFHI